MAHTSPDAPARRVGLFGRFRRSASPPPAVPPPTTRPVIDEESGLGNRAELHELLRREIARSRRYGDRSTLIVFDVSVTGCVPAEGQPVPPSPARFVAEVLLATARDSDLVARLSDTQFAVLLTECDEEGARRFAERARTRISSTPYAQDANGTHLYTRAWAGFAAWDCDVTTPRDYIAEAIADLERTRPGYEREQLWFTGDVD